jgi:nucleotide-binding universal stress UspA family protein
MRRISRILCPVDLSDVSRHAIDHAVLMARWYGAKIVAVHVWNTSVTPAAAFAVAGAAHAPVLTADETEDLREQVVACFSSAKSLDIDVVIDTGQPLVCILERADTMPADLIVIGTHGLGGFEHLALGSVTEKVLRKATCAVMTVPPLVRTASKLPFKRILCPVDFSEPSLAALDFAFSLAQESGGDLMIVHVLDTGDEPLTNRPASVPEYRRQLEHELTARLSALVPDSVRNWCRPTTRLAHGKAYREILGIATEDSADLIVMGVHGRNALDLMLFGSTTNQVVRRATCPVLTLRR